MPSIHLKTLIRAPVELCFDLARNVDVRMAASVASGDRVVAGVTSGMVALGDEMTWEGTHFGVRQRLTSRVTVFDPPHLFIDEMQQGAFRRWRHAHVFIPKPAGTLMIDEVSYASPLGLLGQIADSLYLKNYMTRFLMTHNEHIKKMAEKEARRGVRGRLKGPKF